MKNTLAVLFGILMILLGCKPQAEVDTYQWIPIDVKASAYNSVPSQTNDRPSIAAWGDTLKPGMRVIAVSRDLIRLGLKHNTQVKIEGLDSIFLVKDKMNKRYRNRIDVYMGKDVKRALEWGQKKLTIHYAVKKDSTLLNQ